MLVKIFILNNVNSCTRNVVKKIITLSTHVIDGVAKLEMSCDRRCSKT